MLQIRAGGVGEGVNAPGVNALCSPTPIGRTQLRPEGKGVGDMKPDWKPASGAEHSERADIWKIWRDKWLMGN